MSEPLNAEDLDYDLCFRHKCSWQDHWSNGGTGITLLSSDRLEIYKRAIAEYDNAGVWIVTEPSPALHSTLNDLSDFWKIFERIEKETQ